MEWSNFVYSTVCKNSVRIKSSKNLCTAELPLTTYNEINRSLSDSNSNEDVSDYLEFLKNNEFLVDSKQDEINRFFADLREAILSPSTEYTVIITPTLKCNFYCVYCYENGSDRSCDISNKTLESTFLWIENYLIKKCGIQKIHFKFFGGEPLFVSLDILKNITERIKSLGIKYTTEIITNGYLLREPVLELFSTLHLESLQITLDGPEDYHNQQRMLKDGRPTFRTIVNNFKKAIAFGVSQNYIIRINCCKSNIDLIPALLNEIAEDFSDDKEKIVFSFGFIGKSFDHDCNADIEKNSIVEDEAIRKYAHLYKTVKTLGFASPDYYALSGLCSYKTNDSVIIQANGKITKCLRGIGREEMEEGTVANIKPKLRNCQEELYQECFRKGCPFVPYCHLGCQHELFIKNGKLFGKNCKKDLIEKINIELLRIMYE